MNSRESLISALSEAAGIEHAITCQYLFAAFSLKTHPEEGGVDWPRLERIRSWKAELLRVARQEMAHHGLVCNLLLAIGGAPHFQGMAFPRPARHCPPYSLFELLPFSEAALERFVSYERPHVPGTEVSASQPTGTIDALYRSIREGLERVDRDNPKLFMGDMEHQIANPELRIHQGQYDVDLVKVRDLRSALALIDRLREHDHLQRILSIQRELADLVRQDPEFAPARRVAANPRTQASQDGAGPVALIRHPLTRAAAELFNGAYEIMLLMLTRLYGRSNETQSEANGLASLAFFPMMTAVIRPLGEVLTQMPLEEAAASPTAGPCFEIPFSFPLQPLKRSAWVFIHERLQALARSGGRLAAATQSTQEPWAPPLRPRLLLLHENLERIAKNFEQHMQLDREYVQHMLTRIY